MPESSESTTKFDETAQTLDNGTKVVSIDMRKQVPMNDPNCSHDYSHDPNDADNNELWRVMKCKDCPVGYLEAL